MTTAAKTIKVFDGKVLLATLVEERCSGCYEGSVVKDGRPERAVDDNGADLSDVEWAMQYVVAGQRLRYVKFRPQIS